VRRAGRACGLFDLGEDDRSKPSLAQARYNRCQKLLTDLRVNRFVDYEELANLQTAVQDVNLVLDYVGGEAFEQRLAVSNKNGPAVSMNIFNCKEIAQQHDDLHKRSFIISMNLVQLGKFTELLEETLCELWLIQSLPSSRPRTRLRKLRLVTSIAEWF
jgi:hypothetical protein